MTAPDESRHARLKGRQALRAVRVVTVGTGVAMVLYAITAAFFSDPAIAPPALFVLPVLVPASAAVLFWRPAYRVPECLWLTGMSGFLLGFLGFGWGSRVAPALGLFTVLVVLLAPRDGGASVNAEAQLDDLDATS